MISSLNEIIESIPDKINSYCIIKQYRSSHSTLCIGISAEGLDSTYLVFEGVEYIQCPTSWRGVDIFLGSKDECIEILYKLKKGFEAIPKEYLGEKYHLYKFQHSEFEVYVIALSIYLVNDFSFS